MAGEATGGSGLRSPVRWGSIAMGTILVIAAVVLCCGLCAYGISRAVRGARDRRGARHATG
jgi:hypothetical protein